MESIGNSLGQPGPAIYRCRFQGGTVLIIDKWWLVVTIFTKICRHSSWVDLFKSEYSHGVASCRICLSLPRAKWRIYNSSLDASFSTDKKELQESVIAWVICSLPMVLGLHDNHAISTVSLVHSLCLYWDGFTRA